MTFDIDGLNPFTDYSITVSCCNVVGCGVASDSSVSFKTVALAPDKMGVPTISAVTYTSMEVRSLSSSLLF